ncbi:MAG: hypothetical protein ACOWWM_18220 [Desulfobacterales bacterium]
MKCDNCGATVAEDDARKHLGKTLCEDCYMEVLSPMKTCDPWAVHSAKTFERLTGDETMLTPTQMNILKILKAEGPIEPSTLLEKLGGGLSLDGLDREFAALRHLEKVRKEKKGRLVLMRLWSALGNP